MDAEQAWAQEQFGHADLGDPRLTRRLVQLTVDVTKRPSGIVSRACETGASREGAYRFLENSNVCASSILDAMVAKTAEDCRGHKTVIVAVDPTALSLSDADGSKGLGPIGSSRHKTRGLHALTALVVAEDGTPIGIGAQELWVRKKTPKKRKSKTKTKAKRKKQASIKETECRYWLDAMRSVCERLADTGARPWFQMDRGADAASVFTLACELGVWITVRARANRPLDTGGHLWSTLEREPIRAKKTIDVAAGTAPIQKRRHVNGKVLYSYEPPRTARVAKLDIRAAHVDLRCPTTNPKRPIIVPINAVFVRERGRSKDDRIEWMLLTTHPIETPEDLLAVAHGYTLRWRIEDFHRAWKAGLCRVEETKLRSRNAIYKWSTILAAVATRAMRLTHLARETPDVLASTEFSDYELEAILIKRKPKGFDTSCISTMTLAQAIRWIADTAGYNGPWKGPPGATIVGRGLYEVEVIAQAFEDRDRAKNRAKNRAKM